MFKTRNNTTNLAASYAENLIQRERRHRGPKCLALECTTFKILTNLLNNRLYKMTEKFIPEEQFGFVKGKSTLHAVKCLKEEI